MKILISAAKLGKMAEKRITNSKNLKHCNRHEVAWMALWVKEEIIKVINKERKGKNIEDCE